MKDTNSIRKITPARLFGLLALVFAGLTVGACNTVAGMGQDVEHAGDHIEDAAHAASH